MSGERLQDRWSSGYNLVSFWGVYEDAEPIFNTINVIVKSRFTHLGSHYNP